MLLFTRSVIEGQYATNADQQLSVGAMLVLLVRVRRQVRPGVR